MSTTQPIYHLALPDEWAEARDAGEYRRSTRGRTLAEEGFIHCSFAEQVSGVAGRFYTDVADLLLLTIDPEQLDAPVRVEDLTGGGEAFPHVYGPIPLRAVISAAPYDRS